MSARNPYEDFDAFDPWDDDSVDLDESGDFSFVDDEYDSMDDAGTDGLDYPQRSVDMTAARVQPVNPLPRTQVRPSYVQPDFDDRFDESPGGRRGESFGASGYGGRAAPYGGPAHRGARGYEEPEPLRRRRQREKRGRRRHHGCLITLLLLIGMVVAAYLVLLRPIDEQLAFAPAEQQTLNGRTSFAIPGMPYYLLALGSDAREGEGVSRTDTMLLVRIDFFAGKLTLVSIPRDTKVEIAGYGTSKINAAYAYEGAGGSASAVSKLLGVPIHHVAVVHFEELAGLIDYLGGVTVNVPVAVSDPYTGVVLDEGLQTLDGETAVLWARSRYGYESGDVQRQEDQRILLTSLVNRLLSLSPREIPGALRQIGDLIGTDLRCYDLIPLFIRLRIGTPTIYSCSIPTTSAYLDNQWYEVPDDAALASLMRTVEAGNNPGA